MYLWEPKKYLYVMRDVIIACFVISFISSANEQCSLFSFPRVFGNDIFFQFFLLEKTSLQNEVLWLFCEVSANLLRLFYDQILQRKDWIIWSNNVLR
jgi:hypothetical protein